MKKINSADTIALLSVLALLFTVGVNLGKPKKSEEYESFYVDVKADIADEVEELPQSDVCYIDGKYEARLTLCEPGRITFLAEGMNTGAGILFFGAKYIAGNQPLKIIINDRTFKGRVTKISQNPIKFN